MAWARLDDNFDAHPKVAALSPTVENLAAIGLFSLTLTWAHRIAQVNKQQGLVPWGQIERVAQKHARPLATILVTAELWDADEQDRGCWIHDFTDYGPTRAKLSEAGKRGARRRWDGQP